MGTAAVRLLVAAGLTTFLALAIAEHEHAGLKGMRVPLANVAFSIIFAAAAAAYCRYRFNRLSGWIATPFVGGIAGSFGMLNTFYGQFGGILGFLVGAIVLVWPMPPLTDPHRAESPSPLR